MMQESPRQVPPWHGTRLKRYRVGRVCSRTGCGTKLNIYNPGKLCWRHKG